MDSNNCFALWNSLAKVVFVAVVEFGDKVKAKTILAGGQSGDSSSPHFDDQIDRYAHQNWKDAAYYKEDVLKRAQKTYTPGK